MTGTLSPIYPQNEDVEPMKSGDPLASLKRTARETKAFQWLREAPTNSGEAGATEVHFDIDMASYAKFGVLRGQVEDNGSGIPTEKVAKFINEYGGGGKKIGGAHDNFGIGFKSTTMGWNRSGVMCRTLYDDVDEDTGQPTGLKILNISVLTMRDVGTTGLIKLPMADEDDVDEHTHTTTTLEFDATDPTASWIWRGIDWVQSFPQWVRDAGHGSVFTFLGDTGAEDTFYGNPKASDESATRWSMIWWCDTHWWKMGYTLRIGGCDSNDRGKICKALDQRMKKPGHKKVKHWELRKVRGLHESIYMVPKKAGQPPDDDDFEDAASVTTHGWIKTATFDIGAANLPARCTVYYKDTPLTFSDYGWDPARSAIITSLYMDECYQSGRGQRHQQFGIPWSEIYNFVWIVMEPVLADLDAHGEPDEGSLGCYPTSSRTHLFWQDSTGTGLDLPWDEWAKEFVVRMDAEVPFLAEAIRNHISTSTKGDTVPKTILRKVADQFLGRFKPVRKKPSSWRRATAEDPSDTRVKGVLKRKKDKKAETRTEENGTDPGSQGGQRGEGTEPVEPSDGPNSGQKPGENAGNQSEAVTKPGELTPGKGTVNIVEQPDEQTLPEYRWVPFSTEYRPQLLEPGNADLGVVWIDTPQVQVVDCNVEHNVYTEVVDYWTNEFGTMFRDIVVEVVQDVYGTSMSTAVAHILEQKLDDDSRAKRLSELTTKFYGLYDQHDHIGLRIRGRLGRGAGGSTPGTGRRIAKRVAAAPEPDEAAS